MDATEKKGGNNRSSCQLSFGRATMELCGLTDLGFIGYPYTWSNGREGDDNVQCRLDKALASESFWNRFSPISVTHLPRYGSDQLVSLMKLEDHDQMNKKKRVHVFRFEENWTKDPKCEDIVRRNWSGGSRACVDKLAGRIELERELDDKGGKVAQ